MPSHGGGDDGKRDDGKWDDGKRDDGKWDDGKRDDGKWNRRQTLFNGLLVSLSLLSGCASDRATPGYTCGNCSIRNELVTTLDPPSVELEPPLSSRVLKLADGRYFVVPIGEQGAMTAYDSAGRYLQRIGQRGMGPGEFFRIEDAAVGPGDSIFVLHDNRFTVLAPDLTPARSFNPEVANSGRIAMLGSTILVGLSGVPGSAPVDVAWLQPSDGSPAVTLSVVDSEAIGNLGFVRLAADSSAFLLFAAGTYSKIDTTGVVLGESSWSPPWFDEEVELSREERRRRPHIDDLAIGRGDTVWAMYRRFEQVPPAPASGSGEVGLRRLDLEEVAAFARGVIEVFDPTSGEAIFGGEIGLVLGGFIDRDLLYAFERGADGTVRIAIHRYWLETSPLPR